MQGKIPCQFTLNTTLDTDTAKWTVMLTNEAGRLIAWSCEHPSLSEGLNTISNMIAIATAEKGINAIINSAETQ